MVRKSKQASGNATLTHYELRHKLTADHGTLERRLAGHAQYQLGECGLSLTPFSATSAVVLCSPSGYLYEDAAMVQYLVTQTQQLKEQAAQAQAAEQQQAANLKKEDDDDDEATRKRKAAFEASKNSDSNKQRKTTLDPKQELKRTSYWLAESQPVLTESTPQRPTSTRPLSPHSQQPIRRKDLWPVQLDYDDNTSQNSQPVVICSLTGKPIRTQAAIAYWTDKTRQEPGRVVLLEDGYNQLIVQQQQQQQQPAESSKDKKSKDKKKEPTYVCPRTNLKIQYTRNLQRSGSSFATSGQATVVQQYRPTMT